MITDEQYTILDYIPQNTKLITPLCILNFNILTNTDATRALIAENPQTAFWCATEDFSKTYVQTAGKLGISNVIATPIKTELIAKFFKGSDSTEQQDDIQYIPLNNANIMIVDDNELNIKLLSDILCNLGIKIVTCNNPVEALTLANNEKFDLFLLDILMPEMSGFELAEEIKKTVNSTSPVIFVSAISGTQNVMNGYNLGACSYIEKPFYPNIVKAQIYNLLKLESDKKQEEHNKETFIATLTHDLKSPINAEINALKILTDNKVSNKSLRNEILSELLNSAKYMKLITDRIICHYRQKHAKINLSPERACFNNIVLSCINELKYMADEKNITIEYSSESDNIFANVDVIEIKRVINNLLSNAIEYSHQDGTIEINLEKSKGDLIFTIRDHGIGIDLNKHNRIFDEYITLSKEQKKIGFGLGLNICKKIIGAHKGKIEIESKPNIGTAIKFKIPAEEN